MSNETDSLAIKLETIIQQSLAKGSEVHLTSLLNQLEVSMIMTALKENDGVVQESANQLGILRTTLTMKLRKYQINKSQFKGKRSPSSKHDLGEAA